MNDTTEQNRSHFGSAAEITTPDTTIPTEEPTASSEQPTDLSEQQAAPEEHTASTEEQLSSAEPVTSANKPHGWRKVCARAISFLMHPFLLPIYMVALLVYTELIPFAVPNELDNTVFGVVTMNLLVMPAFCIMILKVCGLLSNWSLSTRKERILPLLIVAISYACSAWIFSDLMPLFLIRRFMLAAFGSVVFAAILNLFWQVSLHLTGAGGAVGILFVLVMVGYGNLLSLFSLLVLLTGALASARFYLGKHTPAQVAVGFLGGFLISAALVLLG